MKKLTILLVVFLLTGCTVVRIDTTSVDNIIHVVLSKENRIYNQIGRGYKYYVPRGVTYMDTNELNDKLYSNGVYYYLYVDAVGYYYKTNIKYEEKKELYYSKKIEGDLPGYLQIKEENEQYYITFFYNYAKIETVVSKEKIEEVVLNASYILSTVKFNENIIGLMLDDEYFTNKEEQYNEFSSNSEEDKFFVEMEGTEK